MMKNKNHKKIKKNPSYRAGTFAIFWFFKPRYLHDQTESWPKVTSIRSGILLRFFLVRKISAAAPPPPKISRQISSIMTNFVDFHKNSGAGKFKNPTWPPEGAEPLKWSRSFQEIWKSSTVIRSPGAFPEFSGAERGASGAKMDKNLKFSRKFQQISTFLAPNPSWGNGMKLFPNLGLNLSEVKLS